MTETDGRITYEINDAIQVVKGQDTGTFGIVMGVNGDELRCWGRCPTSIGAQSYEMIIVADNVMYVGRGKIRPTLPGEKRRDLGLPKQNSPAPVARISARAHRNFAPPPIPPNPPQHSVAQAPPPPAPESQMREGLTAGEKIHGVQFGGVDSDMLDSKPRPITNQEPIDPKLLEPSTFKRVSAVDVHRPAAQIREQQQPQPQQGADTLTPQQRDMNDSGSNSDPGHSRRGRQPRFKRGTQTPSS